MKIVLPDNCRKVIDRLNASGYDAFVVGGCVRDSLLGRIPGDWDITTEAKPLEIKNVFRRTVDTGIEHGTVTVLTGGESYEVTTYRIDGDYADRRHPDEVIFTADLREDLLRRDFTVNAMAYNDRTGLVDEFGGIQDLNDKIIRCVGNADERFDEDALRILRAIRFSAQLGFAIEEKTYRAIEKHAKDLVYVSAERIFTELNKTLISDEPCRLSEVFETGCAEYICGSFRKFGPRNLANLARAGALRKERYLRWAAFAGGADPDLLRTVLKELKSDNETIRCACILVQSVKRELPQDETGIRFFLRDIGPQLFTDMLDLREIIGQTDVSRIRELTGKILTRGDCYSLRQLAVTGTDLIAAGEAPGPGIGQKLNALLEKVIRDPELNKKEKLISAMS